MNGVERPEDGRQRLSSPLKNTRTHLDQLHATQHRHQLGLHHGKALLRGFTQQADAIEHSEAFNTRQGTADKPMAFIPANPSPILMEQSPQDD